MHNRIELRRAPRPLVLDPRNLPLMHPLKHAITRDMEPLRRDVLLHAPQHLSIAHARRLQQSDEIVDAEMAVRTAMRLAGAGWTLRQDALAAEGRIAPAAAVGVAADVAVRVPHVVAVLLVEGVVRRVAEGGAPELKAVLQAEAEAFQEESVLQPAVVLEVRVAPEREVQVAHAEGEVGAEGIDGGGGGSAAVGKEAVVV